eukprot:COSAG01_NODE_6863_length_3465_cov_2.172608_4_plen_320_part_01
MAAEAQPQAQVVAARQIDRCVPQLLIDSSLVALATNIRPAVHAASKRSQPVLSADPERPWEDGGEGLSKRCLVYGTILEDEGKFRMWYMCRMGPPGVSPPHEIPELYMPRDDTKPPRYRGQTEDRYGRTFADNDRGDLTCYAESYDGTTWRKPDLRAVTFEGSGKNNIVWDLHGASVFRDDDAPPERRYQAVGFCRRYRGVFLIYSADGIVWEDSEALQPVCVRANEGPFNVTYDAVTQSYFAFSMARYEHPSNDFKRRRYLTCTRSPHLAAEWTDFQTALEPAARDDAVAMQRYNALHTELHNMSAFRCGNVFIGLVGV